MALVNTAVWQEILFLENGYTESTLNKIFVGRRKGIKKKKVHCLSQEFVSPIIVLYNNINFKAELTHLWTQYDWLK